jgi:Protein of unknown function (DUF3386)
MRCFDFTALALTVVLVAPTSANAVSPPDSAAVSASELLERARQARATWDEPFPGFTADLTICLDGESIRGTMSVSPDGKVELNVPEGKTREWALAQLRSEVMHRRARARPFGSEAEFAEPESSHPLGRLIRIKGDSLDSSYRVKGDQLLEVNRTMGDSKFSNQILATTKTPEGKYLPEVFSVTYWSTQSGHLMRTETFRVTWVRVGKFDLPGARMQVVSEENGVRVRRLELSNHKLSESGPVTADSAKAQ